MHRQAAYALANPTFDPTTQITSRHHWQIGYFTLIVTVNIGME